MRGSIAIKLSLGLGLLLVMILVAAGMSFWQSDNVGQKTANIVEELEPKMAAAYEMELSSVEIEMGILGYIRNPNPALRDHVAERLSSFDQLDSESLPLMSQSENSEAFRYLDELSSEFALSAKVIMDQTDLIELHLNSLETDFQNLDSLATINLRDQMSLYDSYGPKKLMHLQVMNTEIAEAGIFLASYLRSPKPTYRLQLTEHSNEFFAALAAFEGLTVGDEEQQRAIQLGVLFTEAETTALELMDLTDSLNERTGTLLQLRMAIDSTLDQQVQSPVRLQMKGEEASVNSVGSWTNQVTVALLVVGIVFVFGVAFFVFNRITKPVKQLVLATQKVADGDLSIRVDEDSHDEMGLLGAAFNEMIATREEAERALLIGEKEQRRLADENAVNATIGRIVSSSLDIREVYDAFAKQVRTLVRFDWLAVSIFDHDMKGQQIDYVSSDSLTRLQRGTRLEVEGTFIGSVAEARGVVAVTLDYEKDKFEQFPTMRPVAKAGFHGLLGVPLFSRDRVIGVLVFASKDEIPYSESEMTAASTVADQVAGAIAIARTYSELQEAQTKLLEAHDDLEIRVWERTLELQETRDIAEHATEAKSQFLANMSHELRTPLNAIIGYSELLIEMAVEDESRSSIKNLEHITDAGKHLLFLVNDILDLAKVEAGKMEMLIEEFNISSVVEEVQVVSETLVLANNNTMSIDCPDEIGTMITDQVKVRQMLFNLVSNAAKFTENGDISLRTRRELRDSEDWVIFEVSDTGIGITPEEAARLFKPFTQADSSTARKYGGSGLGLSLCLSFARMMGGDVTMETKLGAGSTFKISLPASITGPVSESTEFNGSEAFDEITEETKTLVFQSD